MLHTKLEKITKRWSPENKEIRNLKCVGLINFESRIDFTNSLSAQIKEHINRKCSIYKKGGL